MITWDEVERAEPEFARRVRSLFQARKHHTLATVRRDGAPRISGIEVVFEGGELSFGSMAQARKGCDLRRDPRFALHCATIDPLEGEEATWPGEAKILGRALLLDSGVVGEGDAGEVDDREGDDADHYRADIAEVVHTHLNEAATMLVVDWWTPTCGLRRIERA